MVPLSPALTVEDFGLNRLLRTDRKEIDQRLERYQHMLGFLAGGAFIIVFALT
ncbi:MAG: hypothetical protein KatS3mg105_0316 [Gemmatales bacterium]|nr:MAG: hypothetical protein KatS3mg105_0316 [Gemmatales bacterium]